MPLHIIVFVFSAIAVRLMGGASDHPLDHPEQSVRDAAALKLRHTFRPSPADTWKPLLSELKKGMTLEEIIKLTGPLEHSWKPPFGYMNGSVYLWRLDDTWLLRFEIGRFEPGLTQAELVPSSQQHHTSPPAKFTGVWVDYYASGQRWAETNYRDGVREGSDIKYHENGIVSLRENFLMGVQHGDTEGFYPTGKVQFRGSYLNGNQTGVWISYREDGSEQSREHAETKRAP